MFPLFATSVIDASGKFATGVVVVAGGKLIHEKTSSKKSRGTVPLRTLVRQKTPDAVNFKVYIYKKKLLPDPGEVVASSDG